MFQTWIMVEWACGTASWSCEGLSWLGWPFRGLVWFGMAWVGWVWFTGPVGPGPFYGTSTMLGLHHPENVPMLYIWMSHVHSIWTFWLFMVFFGKFSAAVVMFNGISVPLQRLLGLVDGLNFKDFVAFLSAFSTRANLIQKIERKAPFPWTLSYDHSLDLLISTKPAFLLWSSLLLINL